MAVFEFETGSSKHRQTHTGVAHRFPGRTFPQFAMRPESVLDDVASFLGLQDIDFPGSEAFSENYVLSGSDETAVRALFRPGFLAETTRVAQAFAR